MPEFKIILSNEGGLGGGGSVQPMQPAGTRGSAGGRGGVFKQVGSRLQKSAKFVGGLKPLAAAGAAPAIEAGAGALAAIAGPVGVVVTGFAALGKATYDLTQSFTERGKALAEFSPELAGASAGADIRSMMADMRKAQELGPSIARMIDAQSEASDELRELLLPIKKAIVEDLATILKEVNEKIKEYKPILAAISELIATIIDFQIKFHTLQWPAAIETLKGVPDRIKAAMKKAQEESDAKKDAEHFLLAQFGKLERAAGALEWVPADPVAADQQRRAAAPALAF